MQSIVFRDWKVRKIDDDTSLSQKLQLFYRVFYQNTALKCTSNQQTGPCDH